MKEERPIPATTEQLQTSELLGKESVGLQARLLIGDFMNPRLDVTAKKLQPIKEFGIEGIAQPIVRRYQKASLAQRRSYQEETGLTYDRWKTGFDTYLQKIRDDNEHRERNEFLELIGIDERTNADDFYNEYLRSKSDIVKFVFDVETQATREQIIQHEDIIRGLGNTFGYASSEVIDTLIHGVRNVKDYTDVFIEEAKKSVNTVNVLQHPLLQTILRDSKEREEFVQPPPEREKREPTVTPVEEKKAELKQPPKATPPERVALEEEKEAKVEVQLFPAPQIESKRDDSPLTPEELEVAVQYLLYNDVNPKDKKIQAERIKASEVTKFYTRELQMMMQEYGREFVLDKAGDAIQQLQDALKQLNLKGTPFSKSRSWYLWHIAKRRFLANNPDVQEVLPNAKHYSTFDPLLHYRGDIHPVDSRRSHQAEIDILWATLGFEVYLKRRKRKIIISALDPAMPAGERQLLHRLLDEQPKDEEFETLPTYQLREIGRIVRQYRQLQ